VGRVAVPWRAVGLAVALGGSGVLHLVRPGLYEWLVPPELGGWAAAALLTGFLPAHVHTFRVVPRRPAPMAAAVVRLPLQAPLIAVALRVARGR
jgi:uncharacterized membrane protein